MREEYMLASRGRQNVAAERQPRQYKGGMLTHSASQHRAARALVRDLGAIVGSGEVLTDRRVTRAYRRGYRFGAGCALAVVRPRSLVELWRFVKASVAADTIVIMQAANTGLTGGSTPDGHGYDRPVVIVNTLHFTGIQLIDEARQVVCLPGARLHELEVALPPHGREPHSVIGSLCIGASVVGGICNNPGGALVRRGPAFTELAPYAQLSADGDLQLINNLGIDLGEELITILRCRGRAGDAIIVRAVGSAGAGMVPCRVRAACAPKLVGRSKAIGSGEPGNG